MSQAGIAGGGGGGGGTVQTLTGDTGGAVSPDAAHNIDILGGWTTVVDGNPGTHTLVVNPSVHGYPCTPFVVSPPLFGGQIISGYQTIQSAIDALDGMFGQFVLCILPGAYVENLDFSRTTFDQNISLVGMPVESTGGIISVGILGTHTIPNSSLVRFANINFEQFGAFDIFSGSNVGTASKIYFRNCNFEVSNGYILNLPNWTTSIFFDDCGLGNVETNNGVINNSTGSASVTINNSSLGLGTGFTCNLVGSTTIRNSKIGCPINFGTGATFTIDDCIFLSNVTCASNSTGSFDLCRFTTGASQALTMSSSGSVTLTHSVIDSSNNPAIGGAGGGTLTYADLIFLDNTVIANTLTVDPANWRPYATAGNSVSAVRGTAGFDSTQFIVTNGFVEAHGSGIGQTITGDSGGALNPTAGNWNILGRSGSKTAGSGSTLTINSPPFADQGGSTTVTLNSGSFATAAITLTTPATAGLLDGDLLQFVATNGVLVIQFAATQVGHIGTIATSVAGTFTSTAIGDSVTLRYQASTNDWWATSVIGTWVGA